MLQSARELADAEAEYRRRGLCPPTDSRKAWDNVLALDALDGVRFDDPIVDLGCRNGILLTWLYQQGYRRLWGCDVQTPLPPLTKAIARGHASTFVAGAIMYAKNRTRMQRRRAEATGFPAGEFAAVTSMSVIEHQVDTASFFSEAARMLRPGGILFLSTDFWSAAMVTSAGDHVFGPADVDRLFAEAESAALRPVCRPQLDVGSPVIEEAGLRYTFLTLAFERASSP